MFVVFVLVEGTGPRSKQVLSAELCLFVCLFVYVLIHSFI